MRSPIGHFTSNRYAVPAPLLRCPFTPPDLIAREGAYLQHDLASRNPRNTRRLTDTKIDSRPAVSSSAHLSFSEVACTSGPVFSGVVQSAVERWPFSSRVH